MNDSPCESLSKLTLSKVLTLRDADKLVASVKDDKLGLACYIMLMVGMYLQNHLIRKVQVETDPANRGKTEPVQVWYTCIELGLCTVLVIVPACVAIERHAFPPLTFWQWVIAMGLASVLCNIVCAVAINKNARNYLQKRWSNRSFPNFSRWFK
jgi:glucan phosphoethanolaminetransferase (alkaline phosphatase superfamily)